MSMDAQSVSEKLRSSGLLRTQGLIGGKWLDSYDNKTIKVIQLCLLPSLFVLGMLFWNALCWHHVFFLTG